MSELITVPVTIGFDNTSVIGSITIQKDKLPSTPEFVFSLGIRTLEESSTPAGEVPREQYAGRYELLTVGLIPDANYIAYLRQVGRLP